MAVELTQELGHFDVEAANHGVEAIIFSTSSASVQQSESISGGALTEADGLQDMDSDSMVVADPFGMSLTESSATRRWWEMYDAGALGKELDSTLCGTRQFINSVTGLHLPPLDHHLEFLWGLKKYCSTLLEHREWETMVQTWEHVSATPLDFVGVGPIWESTDRFGDPQIGRAHV